MSDFGVLPTGFSRKTVNVLLAEIENRMKQLPSLGPDVIQTAASPLGQLNGLHALLGSLTWEVFENVYQAHDPDQAVGINLDILGRIRNVVRGSMSDAEFRRAITLRGSTHLDAEDATTILRAIDGVEYAQMWTNESGEFVNANLQQGFVAAAVIGGADEEVAAAVRQYVLPGISMFGNTRISVTIDGVCRSVTIIRPVVIPVTLEIELKVTRTLQGCPPPSIETVKQQFLADWLTVRQNGMDITQFTVRSILERAFPNVEVTSIRAGRDGGALQPEALISFLEIASFDEKDLTVTLV